MTRVLQLRRGNAAENDNFTGMPGEITVDMDAKTLRVHDGETLGGFALQRTNNTATDTGTFNPEDIPDEIWAEKVKQFAPAPFTVIETMPVPMNSNCGFVDYIVGECATPIFVRVALVCQSAEAGYNVGDEVWAFGIGERSNPAVNIKNDSSGMHICLMVGKEKYWANHRDTGNTVFLTDENWLILFRVYC